MLMVCISIQLNCHKEENLIAMKDTETLFLHNTIFEPIIQKHFTVIVRQNVYYYLKYNKKYPTSNT